eukprot:1410905-Pleurochrysis_carterae.AAC.1
MAGTIRFALGWLRQVERRRVKRLAKTTPVRVEPHARGATQPGRQDEQWRPQLCRDLARGEPRLRLARVGQRCLWRA